MTVIKDNDSERIARAERLAGKLERAERPREEKRPVKETVAEGSRRATSRTRGKAGTGAAKRRAKSSAGTAKKRTKQPRR